MILQMTTQPVHVVTIDDVPYRVRVSAWALDTNKVQLKLVGYWKDSTVIFTAKWAEVRGGWHVEFETPRGQTITERYDRTRFGDSEMGYNTWASVTAGLIEEYKRIAKWHH
jgi:hypothetical protein